MEGAREEAGGHVAVRELPCRAARRPRAGKELRKGRRAAPTSGGGDSPPYPEARGDKRLVPSPESLLACLPTFTVTAATCRSIRANGGTETLAERQLAAQAGCVEQGLGREAALGARSEAFVCRGEPEPVSTVGWHLASAGLCGTRRREAWHPASAQEVTAPRPPSPVLPSPPAACSPSATSPRAPGELFLPNSH